MKKFGSKSGFTLVELIVVIAILGILASIAVPAYSGYISKAKEAADYTQLDAIKTAVDFAYIEAHVNDDAITPISKIEVTTGTVTVTPTTTLDISDYYNIDEFDFKSDNTKAEWTPDAGWVLSK